MTHYTRNQFNAVMEAILGERLTGRPDQSITEVSAVQNFELGARKQIGQSIYRYGLAGAVNIPLGVLCQAPVPAAVHHDLVPSASYAAGVRLVELTIGAANITLNEYAGGSLHVNDGTGQGQAFRILSHPAALAGATCVFTLVDPITTAFAVADTLCAITANPYSLAIIHPSPPTAKLVGVPVAAIAAGSFGWFQTRGPAAVLTDGVLYIYQQVKPSLAVDGAVAHAAMNVTTGSTAVAACGNGALVEDSAGAETAARLADTAIDTTYDFGSLETIVGRVMRVEVDTDYSLIDLTLE